MSNAITIRLDRLLESRREELSTALRPSGVEYDLFRLGVARALQRDPKLEQCSIASLAGAILDCARLGLVPAGYDAQAALVPRGNEVQLMVMVGGLVDLALRGGRVTEIGSETVRVGERFSRDPIADSITHEIAYPRPIALACAYAWARMSDGRVVYEIVEIAEIKAARAAGGGRGPAWATWEYEMARKVARRRLIRARRLLTGVTIHAAIEGDIEAETPRVAAPSDREEILARAKEITIAAEVTE